MLAGSRIHVQETLHLPAGDDMGRHDFFHIVRADRSIEGVVRDDFHDRTLLAESKATGNHHIDLMVQTVGFERRPEVLDDFGTFGGFATRTAAAQDLQAV